MSTTTVPRLPASTPRATRRATLDGVPIALRRGLVEVDCGETVNRFFALPDARVLDAAVASGMRAP